MYVCLFVYYSILICSDLMNNDIVHDTLVASKECNAVKEGDFLVMPGDSAEREKLSETDVQMLQSILVHIS